MIYLYIKQHSITGLKYFGKTELRNPFNYSGSGTHWKNHINKHGKEFVNTIEVYGFDELNLCTEFALNFSKDNNIVKSKKWANLREENGLDGYTMGHKHSNKVKLKMSNSKIGKPLSESHKVSISKSLLGHKHSSLTKNKMSISKLNCTLETKQKMSKSAKGRKFSQETRNKISNTMKGLKRNTITCPHCNKTGGNNAMKRYHFDNCYFK